jgi:hypothetical protein
MTNTQIDRILLAAQSLNKKPLHTSEIKMLHRAFGTSKLGSSNVSKQIILH